MEINAILDNDAGDLRKEGNLLRIREANGRAIVTFKGRSVPGKHKSRAEYEIEVDSSENALRLFNGLGYQIRFRYEKYRTEYHRLGDPGVVTLDETPIGDFFEIEGPSPWIDSTAGKLGYDEPQYITASYGRLYLEWCQQNDIEPSHMVFQRGSRC